MGRAGGIELRVHTRGGPEGIKKRNGKKLEYKLRHA
jgi:hypothetical protein